MKTLITDAFDGEHPDDIDAEYEALVESHYREAQNRLFRAIVRAHGGHDD